MFCTKAKNEIKLLLRDFDSEVSAHIDTAIAVTTAIKNAIDSPAGDLVATIIPGGLGEEVQQELEQWLTIVLKALTIADNCKQCTELEDLLQCFVSQLKTVAPDLEDAILVKVASLLSSHLDGGKLTQSVYDLYVQAKYTVTSTR